MLATGEVRALGYVPDEELPALYAGATAVVYPSRYEGFGFPVLEAMASGTPVIASNRSTLPEIAGGHATLVEPDDHVALSEAMRHVIKDQNEPQRLAAATAWARSFTWERCAGQTLAAYRTAMTKAS